MPRNIEIKAALDDVVQSEKTAAGLSGGPPEIIHQVDVFFRVDGARLKLRILGPESGELIRYERPDVAGARTSVYRIARTPDPQALLEILSAALGSAGIVTKTRRLYWIGQTRVHIDRVDGLGDFLEFEVVLRLGQTETEGREIAEQLLSEFEIRPEQLIAEAYVDLLGRAAKT